MGIFKINQNKLEAISEKKIDLERDIQKLTEQNLEMVFGLKFVSGALNQEFSVRMNEQDFYVDTVGFNESEKSIYLIEYKREKSFSIIDQGFAYLYAMLSNKAEFVLEINERMGKKLTKKDINWEASRVIFVSNEFTNYQVSAINFKGLPMILFKVRVLDNGTIDYDEIKPHPTSESINKFIKDKKIQEVASEVKSYTIDDLIKPAWNETRDLYQLFEKRFTSEQGSEILRIKATKLYIAFVTQNGVNFVEIVPQQKALKVYFRFPVHQVKSSLPIHDCSKIGHWTNGLCFVEISKEEQIDEAIRLALISFKLMREKYLNK